MRSRRRATCLAAMMPAALLGLGTHSAASGQARGTLGVTVQVVAPCGPARRGRGDAGQHLQLPTQHRSRSGARPPPTHRRARPRRPTKLPP